jgi:hypothetical protein
VLARFARVSHDCIVPCVLVPMNILTLRHTTLHALFFRHPNLQHRWFAFGRSRGFAYSLPTAGEMVFRAADTVNDLRPLVTARS